MALALVPGILVAVAVTTCGARRGGLISPRARSRRRRAPLRVPPAGPHDLRAPGRQLLGPVVYDLHGAGARGLHEPRTFAKADTRTA